MDRKSENSSLVTVKPRQHQLRSQALDFDCLGAHPLAWFRQLTRVPSKHSTGIIQAAVYPGKGAPGFNTNEPLVLIQHSSECTWIMSSSGIHVCHIFTF
jgi:hypothetical protein